MIKKFLFNLKKKNNVEEKYSDAYNDTIVKLEYISNMYGIYDKYNQLDDINRGILVFSAKNVQLDKESDLIFLNEIDIRKNGIDDEIMLTGRCCDWISIRDRYYNGEIISNNNLSPILQSIFNILDRKTSYISNDIVLRHIENESNIIDLYTRGSYSLLTIKSNNYKDWHDTYRFEYQSEKICFTTCRYYTYLNIKELYEYLISKKLSADKDDDKFKLTILNTLSSIVNINEDGNINSNLEEQACEIIE